MRVSITLKVFITLLTATAIVVTGMYLFVQWSFEHDFLRLVETRHQQFVDSQIRRLVEVYQKAQGWEELRDNKQGWLDLLRERPLGPPPIPPEVPQGKPDPSPSQQHEPQPFARPPPPDRSRAPHMILFDADGSEIVGHRGTHKAFETHPIVVNGQRVGYLGVPPAPFTKELAEHHFEQQHTESLVYIAVGMFLLSTILGIPLAYTLVRPLRRIADASKQLALGDYATRLPVTSSDEIGQLAQDINDLAHALQKTELSRRQWVADISHELRTPLSILRGEIEALQDGMRPFSQQALDSLHGETMQLSRLVDELYQLSLSDVGALRYHKERIDIITLLEDNVRALKGDFKRKEIHITLDHRSVATAYVHADAKRIAQLFRNLLVNSLNHTDTGGRVEIQATLQADQLIVDLQDTAPGVPDAALEQLFERFYRVEGSRSRASGGAGLGLAICRNIVAAHEGRLSAQHSPLGGLWIRLELPVKP